MVDRYIPGFTNMLMRPDLFDSGPAYVDMMPGAMPEQVSMLPFAPEAPAPQGAPAGEVAASPSAASPSGFQFMTDRGRQAGFGKGNTGFLTADPNAQYRMFDERGKNRIVAEGTGVDALRNIYNTANQFNQEQGKKANWGIERLNPTTGRWERVAENDPSKNILGKIADIALPVAGAFLLPGVGGALGGALGAGLGAAGGSALSSVAQGRSLEDTLLRAGLSGVASGGLSALGGASFIPKAVPTDVGGALAGSTLGAGTMGLTGAKIAGLLPEIVVTNTAGAGLGAGLGAGIGSAASGALAPRPSPLQQQPVEVTPEGEMVLTAPPQAGGALPGAAAGADAMARAGLAMLSPDVQQLIQNNIQVEQKRNAVRDEFDAQFGAGLGAGAGEIVVPGKRPTSFDSEPNVSIAPVLPDLTKTPVDVAGPKKPITVADIQKYLKAAGLLSSLLPGGGGGRGALNRIPAGFGSGFGSGFGGSLPRATLPGASTGFAPRTPAPQDYYRYGYGPSQSFFDYVPQGQPNTSRAFTGYNGGGMAGDGDMPGMSGNSFAVNGPGTGRSDEIPAMLSDGEYVIDAETVALLGDGSSKAGANLLDQFRINVRKDKGRDLVKGDFSANAKRPEHYLKGGRT